ncbi:MAG: hypothetical protein JW969_16300 [Spirochaetales bacterium]|nr:hypothetical protein [Spirochaetales bacterium]
MGKEFNKRRNYVIDKNFQFRFIATFILLIVGSLLIFTGGFACFYWINYMAGDNIFSEFLVIYKQVPDLDDNGEPRLGVDGNQIMKTMELPPINRLEIVLPPILINNVIIVLMISIIGIFYSHKIAGPAYRIEKEIAQVLDGKTGIKIRLRKTDKLKTLAEKVNLLIAELDKHRT